MPAEPPLPPQAPPAHFLGLIGEYEKDRSVVTIFEKDGKPYSTDYSVIARAYGVDAVRINAADEFKPALEAAIASGRPTVLDVVMENAPVPTNGHWNIMDIYSPGKKVHHVAT